MRGYWKSQGCNKMNKHWQSGEIKTNDTLLIADSHYLEGLNSSGKNELIQFDHLTGLTIDRLDTSVYKIYGENMNTTIRRLTDNYYKQIGNDGKKRKYTKTSTYNNAVKISMSIVYFQGRASEDKIEKYVQKDTDFYEISKRKGNSKIFKDKDYYNIYAPFSSGNDIISKSELIDNGTNTVTEVVNISDNTSKTSFEFSLDSISLNYYNKTVTVLAKILQNVPFSTISEDSKTGFLYNEKEIYDENKGFVFDNAYSLYPNILNNNSYGFKFRVKKYNYIGTTKYNYIDCLITISLF